MKNIAASVRARLTNQARSTGVTLPSLIERFAIGRLLWRLSVSPHAERFVLKGAQLFSLWTGSPHRPTRDLDLLSFGDPSVDGIKSFFEQLLAVTADPEDGLLWGTVSAGPIRDDQRYGGVRVSVKVGLDGAQVPVQVDIGFGDAITPAPEEHKWKELLGFPEARLLTYPPETVIAEKAEAAIDLAMANSRMKDFFDLDWLQAHREFDLGVLRAAITATFERRESALPTEIPIAYTQDFANDPTKLTQWSAFLRKNRIDADPLADVVTRVGAFLAPAFQSADTRTNSHWTPDVGWVEKSS